MRNVRITSRTLGTLWVALVVAPLGSFACSQHVQIGDEPWFLPPGDPYPPPTTADGGLVPSIDGGGGPDLPASGPPPVFGTTTTLASSPPAISGGTLFVTKDGKSAIAADPDRDQVSIVDLQKATLRTKLALTAGDEPGRGVEDNAARVHVALRGGGAVADIDLATGTLLGRRAVCPAPRGIAYEPGTDNIHVACAGGELVTLPAAGGAATRTLRLDRDLRDVVVQGDTLLVSRLRAADVLHVAKDGTVSSRETIAPIDLGNEATSDSFTPSIAWRMIPTKDGAVMVHQLGRTTPVATTPGGYGNAQNPCDSIVQTAITVFGGPLPVTSPAIAASVLPVDIAPSPDHTMYAVVAAGNGHTPGMPAVLLVPTTPEPGQCQFGIPPAFDLGGQPIAVAYDTGGRLLIQMREPAFLSIVDSNAGTTKISLSDVSREDTGHAIFHSNSGAGVACASCHAEGGDDGRTWSFEDLGARRTPSLRGTLAGTEPYHWDGTMKDTSQLATEVFTGRMSGPSLASAEVDALKAFLYAIPAPTQSPSTDAAAALRGKQLFESAGVGCAGCHTGAKLTSNATVDVGTGGAFQVPSLVGVSARAPYLHAGCAPTLTDRFGSCGGGDRHGHTSQLAATDIADLVSYLESL